ncbi:MAG: chemotaxis response regulator protein-glutamate methylesterase [Archangium sp.]|nr:chemotaxis response regulator protein-glutamate methylesterase [Archangium sp.]
MKRIGVLVIDDSATMRLVLKRLLDDTPDIEVIDTAIDPLFAISKMNRQWPDVIVLDVEMPRLDGLAFLKRLMELHPTPVIICSSLTGRGTETALQALAAGAVAVFSKSDLGIDGLSAGEGGPLIQAVRAAAGAKVRPAAPTGLPRPRGMPQSTGPLSVTTERLVAIGTSTGGTQALEVVLPQLSRSCPGVVVVQHMPPKFTTAFASRLDGLCEVDVVEVTGRERVLPGRVLIAPGGRHLVVKREGAYYVADVLDAPPVNRHCPSVDVLFRSVARTAGRNAVGILMTGMGDDGARGLLEMRQAGALTIAQDEASCVVFGMPKEAINLGAAERVVGLDEVPGVIRQAA